MNLKKQAKKILGRQLASSLSHVAQAVKAKKNELAGRVGKMEMDSPGELYVLPGKNVFFGYYDLPQCNVSGDKLLAHVTGASTGEPAQIVWFPRGSSVPHPIASTKAWCWQQGARLRWHPLESDTVLYNDVADGRYVTMKAKLDGATPSVLCRALYDIDAKAEHGLALNFARLQRLRPGYGYSYLPDETKGVDAPSNDGLFLVDLKRGTETLLFSLAHLSELAGGKGIHYLNHLSISPNGKRFTFFHIWTQGDPEDFSLRFYSCDIDGRRLKCLETNRVSHYCWLDSENMLATVNYGNRKADYLIYNTVTGDKRKVAAPELVQDGHPSPVSGGFVSDTYAQKDSTQSVFRIGLDGKNYRRLLRVYSDPRCSGERRCDLHPRVTKTGRIVVDTTLNGKYRGMLAFELEPCK